MVLVGFEPNPTNLYLGENPTLVTSKNWRKIIPWIIPPPLSTSNTVAHTEDTDPHPCLLLDRACVQLKQSMPLLDLGGRSPGSLHLHLLNLGRVLTFIWSCEAHHAPPHSLCTCCLPHMLWGWSFQMIQAFLQSSDQVDLPLVSHPQNTTNSMIVISFWVKLAQRY